MSEDWVNDQVQEGSVGNGLVRTDSDLPVEDAPLLQPVTPQLALPRQLRRPDAWLERGLVGAPAQAPSPERSLLGREIDFVKLSPTQNMTLLVRTEHPEEEYRDIALKIMAYEHLHAEQVGFVQKPGSPDADISLRMAGGEFCGNACMALAALTASEGNVDTDHLVDVVLETSGIEDLVLCRVMKRGAEYTCELAMPVPRAVEYSTLADDVGSGSVFVRYDDSLHVVIEVGRPDRATREKAESLAARLGETWNVSLIGVMLYDPDSNRLTPLIHVPFLDSMVWERGCGSGAASLGAYLAWKNNTSVAMGVVQPGGVMNVAATFAGNSLTGVKIEGSVRIVAEGKAYL